ncbi:hypothetical protein BF49_2498 [Bradyrhizobium sp.]|nr:hypothetical protein BF49_2498 [Bradyrhizobium sp.]
MARCAFLLLLFGHFNPVQMMAGHWICTGRLNSSGHLLLPAAY